MTPSDALMSPSEAERNLRSAIAFHQRGDLANAEALYRKILSFYPENSDALHLLGVLATQCGQHSDAITLIDRAIALNPQQAIYFSNRGNSLLELKRFEEALTSYERAVTLKPDYAEAYFNRGNSLLELKRFEEALASYERAVALKPDYAEAYSNRGNALLELGRAEEALLSYERAVALKPDYAEAHASKSLCLLLLGDYPRGWPLYEWRWKNKEFSSPSRDFVQPIWLGADDIAGKTVFLHSEQGLGDTIQFVRYVRSVKELGARVILEVPRSLIPLMRSVEGVDDLFEIGQPLPSFDFHCPLLSLPLAFKTDISSTPIQVPYLSVSEERRNRWRQFIGKEGFKIAICWQGNPQSKADTGRSFPVSQFEGISKIVGVRLISLQKNQGIDQLKSLPDGMRVEMLPEGFDEGEEAFLDSAAVMECVDLVITSDTALTHLAGALGVKTWLPLKYVPDWRWMLDRDDSPWYPNHRLFRQPQRGDWLTVFQEMEWQLRREIGSRKDPSPIHP